MEGRSRGSSPEDARSSLCNERLCEYVQERLAGEVRRADGTPVPGPRTGRFTGQGKPRRQDRRWAQRVEP